MDLLNAIKKKTIDRYLRCVGRLRSILTKGSKKRKINEKGTSISSSRSKVPSSNRESAIGTVLCDPLDHFDKQSCGHAVLIQGNLVLYVERYICNLDDLVRIYFSDSYTARDVTIMPEDLKLLKKIGGDEGHRWRLLLKLMRDIVSEVVNSHDLGSICTDLRPQNVLIVLERKELTLSAKLNRKGVDNFLGGCGTSDSVWDLPEWIYDEPKTRATDLFYLGCVLHFCVTRGGSIRINKRNNVDLSLIKGFSEAFDMIKPLLNRKPDFRPPAIQVKHHLFLWGSEKRVSFIIDISDHIESKDCDKDLRKEYENITLPWKRKVGTIITELMSKHRSYEFNSGKDLLRLIRNISRHYLTIEQEIQDIIKSRYEGVDAYFTKKFPKLLVAVYNIAHPYLKDNKHFKKYFEFNREVYGRPS